ncbi:MAG: DAK2 domain-containing protein, partial [Clostridia bacterium]|nr:DAK2 domain-containing protein [Clostridia bacterium]
MKLVKQMVKKQSEFLTVLYGEDVTDEQAEELEAMLNEKYGQKLEITFIRGNQPVYYYIISVE